MELPEHVNCIKKYAAGKWEDGELVDEASYETWCGKKHPQFVFQSVDHVLFHTLKQGRMQTCPACMKVIDKLLAEARYDA